MGKLHVPDAIIQLAQPRLCSLIDEYIPTPAGREQPGFFVEMTEHDALRFVCVWADAAPPGVEFAAESGGDFGVLGSDVVLLEWIGF